MTEIDGYILDLELELEGVATSGARKGLVWPIGNEHVYRTLYQTYGQLEGCPTKLEIPRLHLGLDIDGGSSPTAVHAILPGVVTHVSIAFTQYSGVVVETTPAHIEEELPAGVSAPISVKYLHLQQRSIAVKVGSTVKAGQMIGHVVSEFSAGPPHLHLSILESPSSDEDVLPLDGDSAAENPLLLLSPRANAGAKATSMGAQIFFCSNDEDGAITVLDPRSLSEGPVDIVVRCEDRDGLSDVQLLAPYEARLVLRNVATGVSRTMAHRFQGKLVDDAEKIYLFDTAGTWSSGCWSDGHYAFYFVMTNDSSLPDIPIDKRHSWPARAGTYKLELSVTDVAGNTYRSPTLEVTV